MLICKSRSILVGLLLTSEFGLVLTSWRVLFGVILFRMNNMVTVSRAGLIPEATQRREVFAG